MQIHRQLSSEAIYNIVSKVLNKAIEQFPIELKDCKAYSHYIEHCHLQTEDETFGIIHKHTETRKRIVSDYYAIDMDVETTDANGNVSKSPYTRITAHPIGADNRNYDDVALWIAGQLEGIFANVYVVLNDPSKVGHEIGWRCAYCRTLNDGKVCDHCGAPRAW